MNQIITPLETRRLTTVSGTASYMPFGPWMSAVGVDECKALLLAKQKIGALTVQFAVQTATARTESPGSWTGLASAQASASEYCTSEVSLTSALGSKAWMRFGSSFLMPSGSYAQGDVSVQTSLVSRGMVVGEMPETTLTCDAHNSWMTPWTTRWVPANWVDKVSAGVWLAAKTGAPEVRVAYQAALIRESNPSDWAAAMPGGTASWTTVGDKNTGDVSLTLTDTMWVRFGIQVKSTAAPSSGTLDSVTVGGVVAIRRT